MAQAIGQTRDELSAERLAAAANRDEVGLRMGGMEVALELLQGAATQPPPGNERLLEGIQAAVDDEPRARRELRALRASPEYETAFEDGDPLVSIVIPTYDNHHLLRERSIPSALAQTHERIEVIVVADGPNPDARGVAEQAGDSRVRYEELALRGPYPEDPETRWYVAGVPPYNHGVAHAQGRWIAPLDDDDAFRPDHVAALLKCAREQRAELAYAHVRRHGRNGESARIGAFPPGDGRFALQASLYHAGLAPIFELELADATWRLPYDWSLCRRMLRAGVRVTMLDREVTDYYPSRIWTPRWEETLPDDRPEWEFVPEGWESARAAELENDAGWDNDAVARAYASKWPEFLESIEGAGPLGVGHEAPEGVPMRRDDINAQNAVLAYGHVLARAARNARVLSVLDWGGALGHHFALARRLLPDLELDYHVRELPAVCAEGRRLNPEVTFHADDACLERRYDLVMASGSLAYAHDWHSTLGRLAATATSWLFVTRAAVARRHASFVVRQQAHAYGYDTHYVGWVLNRDELVQAAEASGLSLDREYVLLPPLAIAGAPEDPVHVGLAFTRREPR